MSKQVTDTGEMWVDSSVPSKLQMGFTSAFLEKHQPECWHIIPQVGKIRKGAVLLSLETNDGMVPVVAPFDGEIETFSDMAINFPEKLTADTNVTVFRLEVPKEKTATDYLTKTGKIKRVPVSEGPLGFTPVGLSTRSWMTDEDMARNRIQTEEIQQALRQRDGGRRAAHQQGHAGAVEQPGQDVRDNRAQATNDRVLGARRIIQDGPLVPPWLAPGRRSRG